MYFWGKFKIMNPVNQRIIFTLILCSTWGFAQAGGGWVKKKKEGYYKLGLTWVESDGYFSGGTGFSPNLNSSLLTTSFYAEHGLSDGLSAELYLPFYMQHSVEGSITEDGVDLIESDQVGGPGDINIGLRGKLYSSDLLNISGTVTLGLPTGSAALGKRKNLFTGDGEFNQLLRLDASVPYGGKKVAGYTTLYGAFNNRGDNFSNEFQYGLESGISALDSKMWLIGRFMAIEALGEQSNNEFTNSFTQSMSFTNYMVEAAFYLNEKSGLSVSYTGSVKGNVLLVAPVYGLGLFMDIK